MEFFESRIETMTIRIRTERFDLFRAFIHFILFLLISHIFSYKTLFRLARHRWSNISAPSFIMLNIFCVLWEWNRWNGFSDNLGFFPHFITSTRPWWGEKCIHHNKRRSVCTLLAKSVGCLGWAGWAGQGRHSYPGAGPGNNWQWMVRILSFNPWDCW